MSLLGAIEDQYTNSTASAMVTLRGELGAGFVADVVRDTNVNQPYCTLSQAKREITDLPMGETSWVEKVTVGFFVTANTREDAERIIYEVEAAFIPGEELSADILGQIDRLHMGNYPGDLSQAVVEQTNDDLWGAMLEVVFQLQKGTP